MTSKYFIYYKTRKNVDSFNFVLIILCCFMWCVKGIKKKKMTRFNFWMIITFGKMISTHFKLCHTCSTDDVPGFQT